MRIIAGKFREEKVIIKVWILVMILFLGLLVYFQVGEKNQIYNQRKSADNVYIEEVQKTTKNTSKYLMRLLEKLKKQQVN